MPNFKALLSHFKAMCLGSHWCACFGQTVKQHRGYSLRTPRYMKPAPKHQTSPFSVAVSCSIAGSLLQNGCKLLKNQTGPAGKATKGRPSILVKSFRRFFGAGHGSKRKPQQRTSGFLFTKTELCWVLAIELTLAVWHHPLSPLPRPWQVNKCAQGTYYYNEAGGGQNPKGTLGMKANTRLGRRFESGCSIPSFDLLPCVGRVEPVDDTDVSIGVWLKMKPLGDHSFEKHVSVYRCFYQYGVFGIS